MNFRLLLASKWLPSWVIKGEIDRISDETTNTLRALISEKAPDQWEEVSMKIKPLSGSAEERRATMAINHVTLVESLEAGIGRKEAIEVGRDALFKVGIRLGEESRRRLGVGTNIDELILAAQLLYKILGISLIIKGEGKEREMAVDRCALARHYSELSCVLLSAVDEGVVRGLNKQVSMRFERRMTAGFPTCLARVHIQAGL